MILRRRGHISLDRQMSQKPLNVLRRKLPRMTLVKETYVAFNPIHVGLLGADRVVQDPDARPHLVEQARGRWFSGCLAESGDVSDCFHGFIGLITEYV